MTTRIHRANCPHLVHIAWDCTCPVEEEPNPIAALAPYRDDELADEGRVNRNDELGDRTNCWCRRPDCTIGRWVEVKHDAHLAMCPFPAWHHEECVYRGLKSDILRADKATLSYSEQLDSGRPANKRAAARYDKLQAKAISAQHRLERALDKFETHFGPVDIDMLYNDDGLATDRPDCICQGGARDPGVDTMLMGPVGDLPEHLDLRVRWLPSYGGQPKLREPRYDRHGNPVIIRKGPNAGQQAYRLVTNPDYRRGHWATMQRQWWHGSSDTDCATNEDVYCEHAETGRPGLIHGFHGRYAIVSWDDETSARGKRKLRRYVREAIATERKQLWVPKDRHDINHRLNIETS